MNDTFALHAKEDRDFEVFVEGGAACDAQLHIHNYAALPAATVRRLAMRIRAGLRKFRRYWRLRIYLYRPDKLSGQRDTVLWLEVDRHVIFQYCGQIDTEKFADIQELEHHYWR